VNNREMRRRLIAVKEAAVEDEAMMTRETEADIAVKYDQLESHDDGIERNKSPVRISRK
jgi:hypothetical protein